jgi:hypothetical protein
VEAALPNLAAVVESVAADGFRARRPDGTISRAASATFNSVALSTAVDLLDTNIVSELRKPRPNPKVVAWLENIEDSDLHVSAVTVGEMQAGMLSPMGQALAPPVQHRLGRRHDCGNGSGA